MCKTIKKSAFSPQFREASTETHFLMPTLRQSRNISNSVFSRVGNLLTLHAFMDPRGLVIETARFSGTKIRAVLAFCALRLRMVRAAPSLIAFSICEFTQGIYEPYRKLHFAKMWLKCAVFARAKSEVKWK